MGVKNTETGAVRFEGLVLTTYEKNGYDDSDFLAVVWSEEKGEPFDVLYASTRFAGGDLVTVDATPEVRAKYEGWKARKVAEARAAEAAREAATPYRGKTVKVVRGRKVPLGTVGEVTWFGKGKSYGFRPAETRVGLRTLDGTVYWTAAKNVEVVQ